jgi:hypothetical protein
VRLQVANAPVLQTLAPLPRTMESLPMKTQPMSPPREVLRGLLLWLPRIAAIAGVTLGLALSAPLIWGAVAAGAGLLTLAAFAACGVLLFQALPLLMQRLENRLLRWRKAEARANPIEQLQNDCMRREQRLASFRRALVEIGTQIENMRQMLDERRHLDPEHVLERQERALHKMAQFHEANVGRLEQAHAALQAFRQQVQQKLFEWQFAQAGQVVMEALRPSELEHLMQDLLSDEALRAVQLRFNAVFAELDIEMRSLDAPTRRLLDRSHLDAMEQLRLPATTLESTT